eukprot:14706739-Alexandrium_andersonii.AAC.1
MLRLAPHGPTRLRPHPTIELAQTRSCPAAVVSGQDGEHPDASGSKGVTIGLRDANAEAVADRPRPSTKALDRVEKPHDDAVGQ